MTTQNFYLDINILQTVPSSNINRDDTGSPKTAIYGGVTRSRVSSQSWKRAVRQAFKEEDQDWLNGFRTLEAPELLAKAMVKIKPDLSEDDAIKKALAVFKTAGIKVDKKNKTKALLLISYGQINKLAQAALEADELDKKELKKIFNNDNSLDLALFGRMVADDPSLNVDAACQVAHAISTHEVTPEFDYFTAVDDLKGEDTAGSAMIGTVEYNSATLYRYANINLTELAYNLNADMAKEGAKLFVKDFALSMPTGKENTFANKTLPQYVMLTLREDSPVNLVSAFEEPVKSRAGYLQKSIDCLEEEYSNSLKLVDQPLLTLALTTKKSKLDQADNLNDLINRLGQELESRLNDEDADN